ncbi:uncharacterized protein LOC133196162 [Saccostrea echinata]|uniref:uncharacterized protein LOC133196162 n=1 Tax=Saccostrea echinata TaxID=191078 RepID=UPI002A833C4C|nr:uncharacterized protein LOC133196162 [Saccostrea echinata]
MRHLLVRGPPDAVSSDFCLGGVLFWKLLPSRGSIYKGFSGNHRYCTVCATGYNDEENRMTQQRECIVQNFKTEMPNNEAKPFCKEDSTDGIIPGCGPLPAIDGLFWNTRSGRSIQNNMSTVYEEYFPQCPTSILESNFSSIRCGENLTWNVNPTDFRCLKGCGPLPGIDGLFWKRKSGRPIRNNMSTVYEEYFPQCPRTSILESNFSSIRCGENLTWNVNPTEFRCLKGCGPLPVIDGLFWKTKSGRPIRNNLSTVYEEYFPECPQTSILESNFSSIRCGENLTWNVNLTELRCLKGCGPLPNRFEWRLENGSRAGNESLAGYRYIGLCRPEFKTSIMAHCGRESIWHKDPSQVTCPSEKCDEWYCSLEIQIADITCEPYISTSDTESCNETASTNSDLSSSEGTNSEGNRTPVEHSENPFCKQGELVYIATKEIMLNSNSLQIRREDQAQAHYRGVAVYPFLHCIKEIESLDAGLYYWTTTESWPKRNVFLLRVEDENIKVFQTLWTGVNQEGILEFTVQRGELVYIATKEIMLNSNSLQIRREDQAQAHYRGVAVYPFLHCIKEIELSDAGLYYWTTTESWPKRNVFLLRVEDRGQPDGLESIKSSFRWSCNVQQDVFEYFSSISNMCLASPPSSLSTTKDELECKLKIDAIFRDMEDLRKRISSVEWHRKGNPDNGPSNLILNDLCRAHQNLSIGQLVANLPPNLDLLNTILRFHNDCYFCNRLLYETQQTEPKVFCSA